MGKAKRQTAAELCREVSATVVSEIRALYLLEQPALPALPPPYDLAAEEAVISALLCGQLRASTTGLLAADWYCQLHRALWQVLVILEEIGGQPIPERIASALVQHGLREERVSWQLRGGELIDQARTMAGITQRHTDDLLRQILRLRDEVPFCLDLRGEIQRMRELSFRRQVIRRMQQLDALWRTGAEPPGELLNQLAEDMAELAQVPAQSERVRRCA